MGQPSIFLVGVSLCLAFLTGFSQSLEVTKENQTEVIESGTVDAVTLNCPFSAGEEEDGLVIKWFHRDNPNPIYQWIDGYEPMALGAFKDLIDMTYVTDDDGNIDVFRFSNIRIMNPTTDVSGEYRCRVSTFEEEDTVTSHLVVYNKPAIIQVWTEREGNDKVKVQCEVEDVYPEPEVSLFMTSKKGSDRNSLEGFKVTPSWEDGLYDTKLEIIVDEEDIDGPTDFECQVTIPDAGVEVVNKTYYKPKTIVQTVQTGAVVSGSETRSAVAVLVSLAFLAIWRL